MAANLPDDKYEALYAEIWETKPTDIIKEIKQRLTPEELLEFCCRGSYARARYFANHKRFMPRIQSTDYRNLSEAKELSRYIVQVSSGAGKYNGYSFPIFSFQGIVYELIPNQTLECLLDMTALLKIKMPGVEVAGSHYMCINQCTIKDAAWKILAKVPQTSVLPSRKLSNESSLSTLSSLSNSSSSQANNSSLPPLPTSSSSQTDNSSLMSLSTSASSQADNSGSIPASLTRVVSGVFYLLGQMATRSEKAPSRLLDYHVLVSLDDLSVWIQYCAWDNRFITEEGVPEDEWGFKESCSPFKPDDDPNWARLYGYPPRVLMARVAEDVRSWEFSSAELAGSEIWSDDFVVPAINGAIIKSLRVVNPSQAVFLSR